MRAAAALALVSVALLIAARAEPEPRLEEVGRLVLSHPDPRFGGLSGIITDAGGTALTMVSDRGALVTARLVRRDGRITGIADIALHPLFSEKGRPIEGFRGDAEDIAPDGAGGFLISFEGWHRIRRHPGPGTRGEPVPDCDGFARLQRNSGLEALARAPDGTILAIPERSGARDRPFPVFRIRDGVCDTRLQLPRRGPYLVTGADIGADGRLYVLERHFALIGFAVRLRVFTIDGDRLTGEETLLETPVGALGNMEGVAVWRDDAGAIRILLVADDNFSVFQRSELVEYRLRPIAPPAAGD